MTQATVSKLKQLLPQKVGPAVLVALSILGSAGWLRWQLYHQAQQFQSEFTRQNLNELGAGDTIALGRRLEALSSILSWSCISGTRQGQAFFTRTNGSCGTDLFHDEVALEIPENKDLKVSITLHTPTETVIVATLLILGQLLLLGALARSSRVRERAEMMTILEKERAAAAINRSIAAMTHMLAHDVKKPFSLFKMGLDMITRASNLDQVKSTTVKLRREVERTVKAVNGMLTDVMEIGTTSAQVLQEPVAPEALIEAALLEIVQVYPQAKVSFAYDLQHTRMVSVDPLKVGRVLSNIVGNAVQAMNQRGSIWFRTREDGGLIEFTVGNGGSLIPAENLPKLFDAFFTSGKKGGTGLGLAIAQKVVTAHGGRIWCKSAKTTEHPEGKVEFFFSLPAAAQVSTWSAPLAPSTDVVKAAYERDLRA